MRVSPKLLERCAKRASGSLPFASSHPTVFRPLPLYGPVTSANRPVRTRMPGGVGRGGEKPPLTRLGHFGTVPFNLPTSPIALAYVSIAAFIFSVYLCHWQCFTPL